MKSLIICFDVLLGAEDLVLRFQFPDVRLARVEYSLIFESFTAEDVFYFACIAAALLEALADLVRLTRLKLHFPRNFTSRCHIYLLN